ncbi:hypothetical protein [Streptomyces sp. NPDC006551]|uniref:hypothetical protein n=1 Tax=Streptomyces sp. NPDC006551 TaxID=3157178 RepID=UPI0033B67B63
MSVTTEAERAANARWQARRRRLQSLGQWQPFVDAGPVREHLRKVNAAGMPYMAICERLGLAQNSSLQHLMWGRGKWGPGQQVRHETAELILAYWPSLQDFPDAARIDVTGTRRRVEALAVQGFSRRAIAERVGFGATHFKKVVGRDRVTARLARAVAAVYDEWWNADPLEHGQTLASVTRVRADAAKAGLHSALAWDDDTIDDPRAVPMTDAPAPAPAQGGDVVDRFLMGESVVLDAVGRREAIAHLMEWTSKTPEEIGEELGMSADAVSRSWERTKKKAREEGRRVWRRVYVPQRELLRSEMESAA